MGKEGVSVNLLLEIHASFLMAPALALLDMFSISQHLELTYPYFGKFFSHLTRTNDHHHHSDIAKEIIVIVIAIV